MITECNSPQLEFHALGRREVVGRFDGGRITSDGGGLLLREVDVRLGMLPRLVACFGDYRNPNSVEHSVQALVGKRDLTGERRERARDQGYPLAGSSTLNRLELGTPGSAAGDRYKKIAADPEALGRLLVDLFLESHERPLREIWLDLDATDDPLHGNQKGRFFHGYYGCYCYLPLYIFCGEHLLCARLRPSNADGAAGSVEELERIVGQIRARWPKTRIVIRGDSGFCRDAIMSWCEENRVGYVLGLARNKRLYKALGRELAEARAEHEITGQTVPRLPLPDPQVLVLRAPGGGQSRVPAL